MLASRKLLSADQLFYITRMAASFNQCGQGVEIVQERFSEPYDFFSVPFLKFTFSMGCIIAVEPYFFCPCGHFTCDLAVICKFLETPLQLPSVIHPLGSQVQNLAAQQNAGFKPASYQVFLSLNEYCPNTVRNICRGSVDTPGGIVPQKMDRSIECIQVEIVIIAIELILKTMWMHSCIDHYFVAVGARKGDARLSRGLCLQKNPSSETRLLYFAVRAICCVSEARGHRPFLCRCVQQIIGAFDPLVQGGRA